MSSVARIGILGGTFDPFHRGHIEPLVAIYDVARWSRIVYVPAWVQPFKTGNVISSPFDRFAMAVLATEDDPRLFVSPIELVRGGVSYTVDTLRALRTQMPDVGLDWVIGDDNLTKLHEWKSLDGILSLANFIVLSRGETPLPASLQDRVASMDARAFSGSIVFAPNERVPVSATMIRERVRAGEPIAEFVDEKVARYIKRHELYRD